MAAADPRRDELLAGYVLGDLDEREREQLRDALASDPSLQRQLDELRLTLELLPLALPDAAPPRRLRQRLLRAEQQRQPQAGVEDRPPWRPRPGQLGLAAMACALVALGGQVVQLRGEMADLRRNPAAPAATALEPALQASRTLPLRGTDGHPQLSGQVVVNPGQTHNLLVISGLPPAPPSHVYRLWANVGGATKGCVRFVPNAAGRVEMPIPSHPSSEARSLSITLEPLRTDGTKPDGPQLLTSV